MGTRNPQTLDYADSRNLRGDDARIERLGRQQGLIGDSSPLPKAKGADGQVTVAEKKASVQGQSQRGTLGASSGSKRCSRGKSCGAACIDPNEDCIIDFDVNINTALNSTRQYVSKLREGGAITAEQEEKVKREIEDPAQFKKKTDRLKAFQEFGEMIRSGRVTEEEKEFVAKLLLSTTLTPGQDRNAARVLNYEEVNSILKPGKLEALDAAYKASFVNGKFDPSAPGGMGDYIQKNVIRHTISDAVAEKAYYMLPSNVRNNIAKAGSVKGENVLYGGTDANGKPVFVDKPSKERGIFLVKRWGEQGGLDPYTGKPIDIRNAEPEHMVAFKHAQAKGGGGGDQPKNLTWSAAQPNNNKAGAGDDFLNWKSGLEKNRDLGKERYDNEVYKPAQASAEMAKGRKGRAPADLEAALLVATPQQRVDTMKALMVTYGSEFRYLLRAAGVGWQHQDRDLDHRQGGKPAFMDMDIPKLPGYKVKPSMAVMVALSSVDPSKRAALLAEIETLRKNRIFSDAEAESVRGDNSARLALKKDKSAEYATKLSQTLEQFVPELNVML